MADGGHENTPLSSAARVRADGQPPTAALQMTLCLPRSLATPAWSQQMTELGGQASTAHSLDLQWAGRTRDGASWNFLRAVLQFKTLPAKSFPSPPLCNSRYCINVALLFS